MFRVFYRGTCKRGKKIKILLEKDSDGGSPRQTGICATLQSRAPTGNCVCTHCGPVLHAGTQITLVLVVALMQALRVSAQGLMPSPISVQRCLTLNLAVICSRVTCTVSSTTNGRGALQKLNPQVAVPHNMTCHTGINVGLCSLQVKIPDKSS